jgi:hypothetical protein
MNVGQLRSKSCSRTINLSTLEESLQSVSIVTGTDRPNPCYDLAQLSHAEDVHRTPAQHRTQHKLWQKKRELLQRSSSFSFCRMACDAKEKILRTSNGKKLGLDSLWNLVYHILYRRFLVVLYSPPAAHVLMVSCQSIRPYARLCRGDQHSLLTKRSSNAQRCAPSCSIFMALLTLLYLSW